MLTLKIISSLLFLIATILKFCLDYRWRDGRTNQHKRVRNTFLIVLIVSGSITAILVLVDYNQSLRRQKQLSDAITGGIGVPQVRPTAPYANSNIFELVVENDNEHPVYDVAVRINDVSKGFVFWQQDTPSDSPMLQKYFAESRKTHTVGSLMPYAVGFRATSLGLWTVSHPEMQTFHILLNARNGGGMEVLECRKTNGTWHYTASIGYFYVGQGGFNDGWTNFTVSGNITEQ